MTIRERVLEQWKGFEKKYLNSKKLLEEVNDVLINALVADVGNRTPWQVMEELKDSLPNLVQECQELRNKYLNKQFGDIGGPVDNIYFYHIGLVETYQKIIEYYDSDQSGPTIEEVD